jgi:hypothetical protein
MMRILKVVGMMGMVLMMGGVSGALRQARASEGTVELRNVKGEASRCFAASVLMSNFEYSVLLSCRDLIYPAETNVFAYVLWGRDASDPNDVFKLGTVGFGKGIFETKTTFSELFVTEEFAANARTPSDKVVMRGGVAPIGLLEGPVQPTPTPTPTSTNNFLSDNDSVSPTPVPQEEDGGGFSVLRLVGGILVGIVVFVVIIALISASRRRPIE